MLKNVLFKNH